ncbi:hypothetical protein C8035_v004821 [Colletotrichum spinosum]|uniref:Transcription factor domain-containing protein n=1 Tax=Colletotrichum spinosum TaxID=1347390 RepID=A0A4R8QV97_9PEZI|nr:hypothetical protein C8035_v004821 [Colletotrichum spinosum]
MGPQQPQPAVGCDNSSQESHQVRALRDFNSDVEAPVPPKSLAMAPGADNVFTSINFAEEIDVESRNLLCTYFSYLKDVMYPVGRYSRFDATNTFWFHWTQLDLAYLHSILYTTSFFFDSVTGQKSKRTQLHLYRTIHELNKRLADPTTALTDSTTTVVMAMALIAECFGDVESAHMHVVGLKRIVGLRGGIESFADKPQLQAKLYRAGLVYNISTGAKPVFHPDAASFESAFDSWPELAQLKPSDASCFSRSRSVVRTLGRGLYCVFKDVQDLSRLINDADDSAQKIREMPLEELMTSIQSRLLDLNFDDANILPELLRLSLLAFLTTVFWSFPGVKFEYPHLANQLRQACLAFTPAAAGESYLFAWALMGFRYTVKAIGDSAENSRSTVGYKNNTFHNCVPTRIAFKLRKVDTAAPSWWLSWSDSSTMEATVKCGIITDDGLIDVTLAIVDASHGDRDYGYVVNDDYRTHASVWWGTRLLNAYWNGVMSAASQMGDSEGYVIRAGLTFTTKTSEEDILTDAFFDLYWWMSNDDSTIMNKGMDKNLSDYNSEWYGSPTLTEALHCAKILYSLLALELGTAGFQICC